MISLGNCYLCGIGTAPNAERAVELYSMSAEMGNTEAQTNLGLCCLFGVGVSKKDKKRARALLMQASSHGDERAYEYLSLYFNSNKLHRLSSAKSRIALGSSSKQTSKQVDQDVDGPIHHFKKIGKTVDWNLRHKTEKPNYQTEILHFRSSEIQTLMEQNRYIIAVLEQNAYTLGHGFEGMDKKIQALSDQIDELRFFITQELQKELLQAKHDIEQKIEHSTECEEEFITCFIQEQSQYINSKSSKMTDLIEDEEKHLRCLFGEKWDKLCFETKASLRSAGVLWKSCADIKDDEFDFSGISISAASALERELKRCFYTGLQCYALKKLGNPSFENWPEALLSHTKSKYEKYLRSSRANPEKYPEPTLSLGDSFTIGNLPYIIGKYQSDSPEQDSLLHGLMTAYLKEIIYDKAHPDPASLFYGVKSKNSHRVEFVKACETLRTSYRNPATHCGIVSQQKAGECYTQIVGKLESFNYSGKVVSLILWLYEIIDINKLTRLLEMR